jgi:hypothetical protein
LTPGVTADCHPLGVSYPFRVLSPTKYRPHSVGRSRSAVGHSLGSAVFPGRARGTQLSDHANLSSGFTLRQSLTQRTLADQPKPTDSSHGLHFPTALEDSEVHSTRAFHARYVPPSGFGYPLDGLLPPSPCRFCFTPAALMGFALRSLPLSQGIHAFPRRWTHLPFHLSFLPLPEQRAGPTGRGSWALTLTRVPCDRPGVSEPSTGCSLGLYPSRACHKSLKRDSARSPLTRFPDTPESVPAGAPEYRSALASPRPTAPASRNHRTRQPF